MEYYALGRTGLKVTRLSLGTMTFGEDWGWGANESASREVFDLYLEAGGNFIDTADLYVNGKSEELLGKFIRETGTRDRLVVSTKFGFNAEMGNPNAGGNGRKNILRAVERSLKRLGTDYLDLYFLHSWDRITPSEEVMRTIDDLISSGKVLHFGLSNVPAWYASRCQTMAENFGYEKISTLQMEYNLVERNIEFEFLPMGKELGMGVMVWSPLAGGFLSGKYVLSDGKVKGEGRLKTMAGSGNPAFEKFNQKNFKILEELQKVSKEMDRPMAQVALNWVLNRPGVASVLVGARKPEQLRENLGALEFSIPDELQTRLDAMSRPERPYPYLFFGEEMQPMVNGEVVVKDKWEGY